METSQCGLQPLPVKVQVQHFIAGLFEECIFRIKAGEDIVNEPGGSLYMAGRFQLPGRSLMDKAGNPGNFPELAPGHFRKVEGLFDIGFEFFGVQEIIPWIWVFKNCNLIWIFGE